MVAAAARESDDRRRSEARRLRVETRMSLADLRAHFGVSRDVLAGWLEGLANPDWTLRPRAKDEARAAAIALRQQGRTVPQIAAELGVSRSSAYLWVRHLPLEATAEEAQERRRRNGKAVAQARWDPVNRARDADRAGINRAETAWVGDLSEREVRLLGAVAYWCEGQKAKPWQPNRCRVVFINSDPALIQLFLRFAEQLGADRRSLNYRISIHESADIEGAGRWWSLVVDVPLEQFRRPTLKKHNPTTVRHNVGAPYRGCLVVEVPKSRRVYWHIEGIMQGIGVASGPGGDASM